MTSDDIEPEAGEPQPCYKYLWKQGLLPKRQHEAAGQLADMLSVEVLTVSNFADELLNGSSGDKTAAFIEEAISEEVRRILGPIAVTVGKTLGVVNFQALQRGAGTAVVDFAPTVFQDEEYNKAQAKKIAMSPPKSSVLYPLTNLAKCFMPQSNKTCGFSMPMADYLESS
jgi:hypothetical protein